MEKSKQESETPLERCKGVLEDFLLNYEYVPICSDNFVGYLNGPIADYLVKKGHEDFLVRDISFGPQVGGISERALIYFAREGKVFDGKAGKYRIKETYGVHSVRLFQAWPA